MGWTTSGDTRQQLRLWFDTREEAIAYAEREGIAYRVEEPHEPKRRADLLLRQLQVQPRRSLDALTELRRAARARRTGPVAQPDRATAF